MSTPDSESPMRPLRHLWSGMGILCCSTAAGCLAYAAAVALTFQRRPEPWVLAVMGVGQFAPFLGAAVGLFCWYLLTAGDPTIDAPTEARGEDRRESPSSPETDAPFRARKAVLPPEEMAAAVREYLRLARAGDVDSALFGLVDLGPGGVPSLQTAFRQEPYPELRGMIVHAVWQQRLPSSVAFLSEALEDPVPEVWKQALDGLVTVSTPEARTVLQQAAARQVDAKRRAWIVEAWEQLGDAGTGNS